MTTGISQCWRHPGKRRYYRVQVFPDLFGSLCLVRSWGSLDNARGNCKTEPITDWQEAQRRFKRISQERLRNGYRPIYL
ncbi:MAG TPA: WGR domain-containing protein [Candidatus Thiothrix moscowensis]|uniref:WGR domain-containing protein n=1 Tax=unclassified Thiothrix TaxID=2636184 RepID=UPI0025E08E84|nr:MULTISPECIES: WGR domain-containing protein [unclassified Thiothrix]HRJ52258.1 WGR domain-containing protein [Candidatus Thiothrix moscowensis]HRJ92573.1 WGR domain-containing protein [Candidatus Thiothrix moscowensis]